MGLDKWISVSWVRWWRGFGSVVAGGFGSWRLVGFWVWIGAVYVDRCCGFGSVLLWSCLVIVVVGGDFGNFLCFFSSWWLFLMV